MTITKRSWVVALSFILVMVMAFSVIPQMGNTVSAADDVVLTVKYNGTNVKEYTGASLAAMQQGPLTYSRFNNMGNYDKYEEVKGVILVELLNDSGVSPNAANEIIEVSAPDAKTGMFTRTFTKDQLLAKRYYYPNGEKGTANGGNVTAAASEGAVDVPAMIGLTATSGMKDEATLCFGQLSANDRNAPNFVGGLTGGAIINVTTKVAVSTDTVKVTPAVDTIAWGEPITMEAGKSVIYYTEDGSEPTIQSYVYNYDTKSKPGKNRTVAAPAGSSSFTVKAFGTAFGKLDSNVVTKNYKVVPPVVAGVKAASSSYNGVKVSWTEMKGADGYNVYRATSQNGKYSKVATVNGEAKTSYTNSKLKTGSKYFYKVTAFKGSVEGETSAVVSAKPVPAAPKSPKAKAKGKKKAVITAKKVSGQTGYKIYRSTKKNKGFKAIKTVKTKKALKFTDKKVKSGKKYYYKIKTYRKVGSKKIYSPFSKVVYCKVK